MHKQRTNKTHTCTNNAHTQTKCAHAHINAQTAGILHQPANAPQNPQVLEAQRALQGNINNGLQTTNAVTRDLQSRAALPPLGADSVSHVTPCTDHRTVM